MDRFGHRSRILHSVALRKTMSETKRELMGPASYFPSIEKKFGQPIEHWLTLLKGQKNTKRAPGISKIRAMKMGL
jgi:hypothetical protein